MNSEFSNRYVAHYGLRTRNLAPMIDWYARFFDAKIQHDIGLGVFMTWDNDHHRLVIWTDEETTDKDARSAGIDHVGIGLPDFLALAETYEKLKGRGIEPDLCVNHLFSTSFYYHDPDGNEVELTVDNFPSKEECSEFLTDGRMGQLTPPFYGYEFQAGSLAELVLQGADISELARLGASSSG
ncbi:VOC family protein [soil metagenome]